MAVRSGLVNKAYITANFRAATVSDFAVGAGYFVVLRETPEETSFAIHGRVVGTELIRESTLWLERINREELFIATTYSGTPIGGGIF